MERRQVATFNVSTPEMDKETQVKCMRSTTTTTPLSVIAQTESQDCIGTPSNPELKINYPSITKKPLVTPTFDPINMSKFKGIGKKPITKTSSVLTAKAKRSVAALSKDLELKTLIKLREKSGEPPKIVSSQKYFSSLSKLSSELPPTRAVTAHTRRVTSSKSPEKGPNSNSKSYCQFNSSMNFKTSTRPKTVQTFLGRSLPVTSSSASGKKPVPGALLDTLSYFQEKSSVSKQQVTSRSRSKSKLGEQNKEALNIIVQSPYTTTSTKLPTIANPQLGSRSRFTKNSLENISNVKNGTAVMSFHSSGPGSRPRSRQTGKDNSNISVVKDAPRLRQTGKDNSNISVVTDAPAPNNLLHPAPRPRSRQLTAKDKQTTITNLPSAIRPHFRLTLKDNEVKAMPSNPNLRSVTHSAKQTVKENTETKDGTELINLNKVKVTHIRSSSRQTANENSDMKDKDEKVKVTTTSASGPTVTVASVSKPKFDKSTLKCDKMTKILPTAKPKAQKLSERLSAISIPIPPVPVPEQRIKNSNQRFQVEIKSNKNKNTGGNNSNSSADKPSKATVPVTAATSALSLPTPGSKICSLKQNENQTISTINENPNVKVKSPKSNRIQHESKPTYARPFTPTTPKSTRLSRPSSAAKAHHSSKYIDDNFSALLLQTLKLSLENENGITLNFPKSSAATTNDSHSVSTYSDQLIQINDISIPQNIKMDNVDNLPFPVSLKTSNENNYAVADKESETTVINPPVNTPVSPKSPTTSDSDCSKYDTGNGNENKTQPRSTNKGYYGDGDADQENEQSSLTKLGNTFSHDFIDEYLQLESIREVNHVPQVMFRAKVCREFKGADPNLTLEHLKFTRSHYLLLPCFADPQFFLKIKVPPIAFMGNNKNKKLNSDLLTIQYFQNKMESLSRNNLRSPTATAEAQTFLRRDKTDSINHQSATTTNLKSLVSTLSTDSTRDNPSPGFGTGTGTGTTGTGKTTSSKDLFSSTSLGGLGIGNLTKAFYIQSLQTIFKSLELPVWAKDCFGSMSDDEFDDCNDDDDDGLDIDDGEDNDTAMGGDGDTHKSHNIFNFTNSSSLYKPSSTMIESPAGAGTGTGHGHEDGGTTLAQRILNIYESRKMKNIQNIEVDIDKSVVLKKKGEKAIGSRKARDFEDESPSDNSADSQ